MAAAETAVPVMGGALPKMHVSLNVRDIARSVAFYEAFFGVTAHKRRPGYANFDLASPPLKLALTQATLTEGRGTLSHLGIQVGTPEEVQAARERLTISSLATFDEGDTTCCYARQDKVWATDPDGNGWEVYILLDEMNEEKDDHFDAGGKVAEATACCTASAQAKADGPACCVGTADGSACC